MKYKSTTYSSVLVLALLVISTPSFLTTASFGDRDYDIDIREPFSRRYDDLPNAVIECIDPCAPSTLILAVDMRNLLYALRSYAAFFEVIEIETREVVYSTFVIGTMKPDSWISIGTPWYPSKEEAAVDRYELKVTVFSDAEKTEQISRVARAPLILNTSTYTTDDNEEEDCSGCYSVTITELYAYTPHGSTSSPSTMLLAAELKYSLLKEQPFAIYFQVIDAITDKVVFSDYETGTLDRDSYTDDREYTNVIATTPWTPEEEDGNYNLRATVYSDIQKNEKISRTEQSPIFIGSSDIPAGSKEYDIAVTQLHLKDIYGNEIGRCENCVSTTIMLTAELKSYRDNTQSFIAYIEVRDIASGYTVYNGFQTGTLMPESFTQVAISWVPEDARNYQLRAMVFDSFENMEIKSALVTSPISIAS